MLLVPGCTRLNSAYGVGDQETDGQVSVGDEGSTSMAGRDSVSTIGESGDDDDPLTGSDEDSGDGPTTGSQACLEVFGPCDPYDGLCPVGEHCRPWTDDGARGVDCVQKPSLAQPLELDESCEHLCDGEIGADHCGPRLICDPFSDEPTCVELCGPEQSCPGAGFCEPHDGYGICRRACDLLEQNCPEGLACYTGMDVPTCQPTGSVEPGDPCDHLNDCIEGALCALVDPIPCAGTACCAALCDLGRGVGCEDKEVCIPFARGIDICAPA